MSYPTISNLYRPESGCRFGQFIGQKSSTAPWLTTYHRRPSHVLIVSDDASQLRAATDFLRNQLFRVTLRIGAARLLSRASLASRYHPSWNGAMHDMDPFMMGRLLMQTPDTQAIPLIFLLDPASQATSREAFPWARSIASLSRSTPRSCWPAYRCICAGRQTGDQDAVQRARTPAAEELLLRNALNAIATDARKHPTTVRQLARQIGTNERKLSALFKVQDGEIGA